MELFIPEIGTKFILNKDIDITLYSEYRNDKLFKALDLDKKISTIITLPKGLLLKVDRIYIRKGNSQYSSLTFNCPSVKTKADKEKFPHNIKYGGTSFWVKLHECNTFDVELLESNKETIELVKKIYLDIEKDMLSKNERVYNSTNILQIFNRYLGQGLNINNLTTNKTPEQFLNGIIINFENSKETAKDYFISKFKTHLRNYKIEKII